MLDTVLHRIDSRQPASLDGLKDFLRIPSVSTKPDHAPEVKRCAHWLSDQLKSLGLWTRVEPTPGHPIVLAGNEPKPGRPTVLLYGHYDVQPPEPLDQWITPPFEPSVRKTSANTDALFARGAVDDKGQVWAHLEAIRAWQQSGGLPVNLIILIEGEEEIGSSHLDDFLKRNRDSLKADIAVISDTGQFDRGVPAITCGLRGLVYMEVIITAVSHDLHSGAFGGAVPNPANILCELLATLHDRDGRVNLPGFYDDVAPLSSDDRAAFARLPFNETEFIREIRALGLTGEAGYTTLERCWARPTCDINGLTSGYQGPGAKTIIPATASAKVSMRLVPHQDPEKIQTAFMDALRQRCPKNVKIDFKNHGKGPGIVVPSDSHAMQLARRAVKTGFGADPVLMREGGSIPVVGQIKSILGLDTLLVGFGLPDDRAHSPNEKFDLDALHKGTRTAAALYHELAALKPAR